MYLFTLKLPQSNLIAVVKFKFERMFVFGFFFQFLCLMPQRIFYLIFFNIVCRTESLRQRIVWFGALSHCDKHIFCWLYWVAVTNKVCICSKKEAKKSYIFWYLLLFVTLFLYFMALFMPFFSKYSTHFGIFGAILFVAVTQCDKQKVHLSQWLKL